jgi:hypothetical protein
VGLDTYFNQIHIYDASSLPEFCPINLQTEIMELDRETIFDLLEIDNPLDLKNKLISLMGSVPQPREEGLTEQECDERFQEINMLLDLGAKLLDPNTRKLLRVQYDLESGYSGGLRALSLEELKNLIVIGKDTTWDLVAPHIYDRVVAENDGRNLDSNEAKVLGFLREVADAISELDQSIGESKTAYIHENIENIGPGISHSTVACCFIKSAGADTHHEMLGDLEHFLDPVHDEVYEDGEIHFFLAALELVKYGDPNILEYVENEILSKLDQDEASEMIKALNERRKSIVYKEALEGVSLSFDLIEKSNETERLEIVKYHIERRKPALNRQIFDHLSRLFPDEKIRSTGLCHLIKCAAGQEQFRMYQVFSNNDLQMLLHPNHPSANLRPLFFNPEHRYICTEHFHNYDRTNGKLIRESLQNMMPGYVELIERNRQERMQRRAKQARETSVGMGF